MRLSLFLHQVGHTLSVLNPARVVAFRLWEGGRTKTDKQDARLIAHFCARDPSRCLAPHAQELQHLRVLLMRLQALQVMERQEANRLENCRLDAQRRQEIEEHRQDLQTRIQGSKKRLHAPIEHHKTLKERCTLLITLPGIVELSYRSAF